MVLDSIVEVSSIRINLPNDLTRAENKLLVKETMKEIIQTYKGVLPLIEPVKDMKIEDEGLEKSLTKKAKLEKTKEDLEAQFEAPKLQVY